ncbi:hypothetical protein Maq22A_c05755 [Methylobacterium aquaticum]|uniref:Uncharacterized protein n=2 Tax=Methylobacterium TaxID=407 RepID=A0A0C6EWQ7_9HYPH|nr:hypothetical protein Maq22A_c05755 [Methylobacterium aquaticum]
MSAPRGLGRSGTLAVLGRGQPDRHEAGALVVLDPHQHRLAAVGLRGADAGSDVGQARDRLAADVEDDVALLDALGRRRAVGIDAHHRDALAAGADLARRGELEAEPRLAVAAAPAAVVGARHLGVVRQRAEGHLGGLGLAVADIGEIHLGAGLQRGDPAGQLAGIAHRLAVDRLDHVAGLQARLGGGRAVLGAVDQGALGLVEAEAVGDVLRHRLDLKAEIAAGDLAVGAQLVDHRLHRLGRDREGEAHVAAGRRGDRGVHAHDLTLDVEGRPAGIALVDRCVDLQEVVVGSSADVAAAGRDDAGGDGAAQAERVADCHDPVADLRRAVGELHVGKGSPVGDLEERQVGLRIGADDLGRQGAAVVERDLDRLGVVHDVVVGDHVAVGRDEEARPLRRAAAVTRRALHAAAHAAAHAAGAALAEAAEELAQLRRHVLEVLLAAALLVVRGVVLQLHLHRDHARLHPVDDRREAARRVLGGGDRGLRQGLGIGRAARGQERGAERPGGHQGDGRHGGEGLAVEAGGRGGLGGVGHRGLWLRVAKAALAAGRWSHYGRRACRAGGSKITDRSGTGRCAGPVPRRNGGPASGLTQDRPAPPRRRASSPHPAVRNPMDIAVSVISLLLVLVLIARGVPGRNLLVALAMALAVVVLVVGIERAGLWPASFHTR